MCVRGRTRARGCDVACVSGFVGLLAIKLRNGIQLNGTFGISTLISLGRKRNKTASSVEIWRNV